MKILVGNKEILIATQFRSYDDSFVRLQLFCLYILPSSQLRMANCTIVTDITWTKKTGNEDVNALESVYSCVQGQERVAHDLTSSFTNLVSRSHCSIHLKTHEVIYNHNKPCPQVYLTCEDEYNCFCSNESGDLQRLSSNKGARIQR